MPLTKQTIEDIVVKAIKSQLDPFRADVEHKFDAIDERFDKLEKKNDTLNTSVVDLYLGDQWFRTESEDKANGHSKASLCP